MEIISINYKRPKKDGDIKQILYGKFKLRDLELDEHTLNTAIGILEEYSNDFDEQVKYLNYLLP